MLKYLKRKSTLPEGDDHSSPSTQAPQSTQAPNLDDLPSDPGQRHEIMTYSHEHRDQVRRAYLQRGPCQSRNHVFPYKEYGTQRRQFNVKWFDEHKTWLEYSVSKDSAYCLCCYLFKSVLGGQSGGDHFVTEGFSNWKNPERLFTHVGSSSSPHNIALGKCRDLMNQNQHIETILSKRLIQEKKEYKMRLNASIEAVRYLSLQGLAFRGHRESESSSNRGNFIEFVKVLGRNNEDVNSVTLENAPGNLMLTSPKIQKDIVGAFAIEIRKSIMSDLGDAHFCLLVDEALDTSMKEQMAMVIRYVNRKGQVVERFLGVEHVADTTSLTLKATIDDFLLRHGLSMSRLRGQGYDGASNMRGEFNGLKALILNENSSAYYIHCFAHQLQLVLVAVARNNDHVESLFEFTSRVLNVVGSSCKRRDMLRNKQSKRLIESLNIGEISSGQGLNQETNLKRGCDTRWGSHYNTLISLIHMFGAVIDVLEIIGNDSSDPSHRTQAIDISERLLSFDFLLTLFLMRKILAITNELSQALQRKNQDIVNAMTLVKSQCQALREKGWDALLEEVSNFCRKYEVHVPEMDAMYVGRGRRRRNVEEMSNLHHYQVMTFNTILDSQLMELNDRFSESTMELLSCLACLDPTNSFSGFDKEKLLLATKYYRLDFSELDTWKLSDQLDTFILDMRMSSEFSNLNGLGDLAEKLVTTRRNEVYPLVYLLLTLGLTLPVATATVERAFSAMNIIKSDLRNRMGEEWLSDALLIFIERDVSTNIDNSAIMETFQTMKTRKGQL